TIPPGTHAPAGRFSGGANWPGRRLPGGICSMASFALGQEFGSMAVVCASWHGHYCPCGLNSGRPPAQKNNSTETRLIPVAGPAQLPGAEPVAFLRSPEQPDLV